MGFGTIRDVLHLPPAAKKESVYTQTGAPRGKGHTTVSLTGPA